MRGISCLADNLLASQAGLCSKELVIIFIKNLLSYEKSVKLSLNCASRSGCSKAALVTYGRLVVEDKTLC